MADRLIRRACRLDILLSFALTASAFAQVPFDKAVSRIWYAKAPENALFAYSNGLFRSRDAGQTWTALHMREPGLAQPTVTELLVHPSNPRTLYAFASGAPARVWKSTDGGDRWADASAGLPETARLLTDPAILTATPDTLYMLIDTTIFVTRNGGSQWAALATVTRGSAPTGAATIGFAAAPSMAGRLYYWSGGGLFRSDDEGANWRLTPLLQKGGTLLVLDAAVHPRNADELVVVTQYLQGQAAVTSATLVSIDGGQSYLERDPKGTAAVLRIDHAGNYHYQGCCRDYCRSTNRAVSWQCTRVGAGPAHYAVDPQNADIIYYVEGNGVARSIDGATTRPVISGTARPTLEKPDLAPRISVPQGTSGSFVLPLRTVEHDDWRIPFEISGVPPWLRLSATSGTTLASVTASIDTATLPLGVQSAELTLRSSQASVDTKLALSLVVSPQSGAPAYTASQIAGGGNAGAIGFSGPATQAAIIPSRIALDASGNLYMTVTRNSVHRIDTQNRMTHIGGTGVSGSTGDGGPATNAQIGTTAGTAVVGDDVYVFQISPSAIRRISGGNITTVASAQQLTPISASASRLRNGSDGTLIFASGPNVFRYVPNGQRVDRTIAGVDSAQYTDVAVAPGGNYYVMESSRHVVYLLRTNGTRTLIAGSGLRGFAGDGGPASEALLSNPSAITSAADGTLYIADTGNARIRVATPDSVIRTYAGDGRTTGTPTGDLATQTPLASIVDIALAPSGDLFIVESSRITKLTRASLTPAVSPGGLLHQSTGRRVLSQGGYFSIYGTNLAASSQLTSTVPWPTSLNGVEVRIQGRPVPLFFVSSNQINGQVPYEIPPGEVTATVTVNGVTTSAVSAEVRRAAPGVLTYGANHAVAVNADGGINGVQGGAAAGETVVVYLTGVGPVEGPPATAAVAGADPLPRSTLSIRVTVGGSEAVVGYLGLTPGYVGLAQANVVVPALPTGDHPIVVTVDGVDSNPPLLQVR